MEWVVSKWLCLEWDRVAKAGVTLGLGEVDW
jgi:hypothetical protein